MTVILTRASASSIMTLRSRVSLAVGDPDETRYSAAQRDQAINDQLFEMYNVLSQTPESFLQSATLSYAANATTVPLGAALQSVPIYSVEDATNASAIVMLPRLAPVDLETRNLNGSTGFTIEDTNISLRPTPSNTLSLRVRYIGNPFTIIGAVTPATDQHPYPVAHEELIVLGAARRLERIDDQVAPGRDADIDKLWERYYVTAARYRGNRRVRSTRRYG